MDQRRRQLGAGPEWKLNQHRDDAARDASVNVVKNVFYPAVREADSGVPLVPKPYNPVHDSGDQPSAPNNGWQPSSSGNDAGDKPTTVDPSQLPGTENTPESTAPSSTNPAAEQENSADRTTTTPAGTDPSTQPASTNPDADPSLTRPGTPSPGSPGTPSPVTPNPGVPGLGTPAPGRSINGTPRRSQRHSRRRLRASRHGSTGNERNAGHDGAGCSWEGR